MDIYANSHEYICSHVYIGIIDKPFALAQMLGVNSQK